MLSKKSKEDTNIDKILQQEKRYDMKRLFTEFPNKRWQLTTVKRLQRKIDDKLRNGQQTN